MKKKVKGVLIVILLMLALSACGTSKPSNVVEDAMKHMQNNEISEVGQYFYTDSEEEIENENQEQENQDESESYSNVVLQAMTVCAEENAGYIKYEIADSTIDDEEATVTIDITYKNAGPVLKLAMNDLMNQSISSAFSSAFFGGGELNDDDMSAIFLASFEKAKENAAIIDKMDTLEIHCKKVNKEWKITNYEELLNVYYCNMYDSLDSISSSSDEDVSIEENTDPSTEAVPDSSDNIFDSYRPSEIIYGTFVFDDTEMECLGVAEVGFASGDGVDTIHIEYKGVVDQNIIIEFNGIFEPQREDGSYIAHCTDYEGEIWCTFSEDGLNIEVADIEFNDGWDLAGWYKLESKLNLDEVG